MPKHKVRSANRRSKRIALFRKGRRRKPHLPPSARNRRQRNRNTISTSVKSTVHPTTEPTKIIAFYLPQFHRIPENDSWWGEGFTEWTNTRKSRPLYAGHYQPREPFGDHYYDLTHPETQQWQAELARSHGIYGFCYYHYWFQGKLLLEKPLEQMLESGQPIFPFCLSWANEPWTRKWDGAEHEILIQQEYGSEPDWKQHFEYLLRAFRDPRYIRVKNQPMLLIYQPSSIPNCEEMLAYWRQLARENGLEGIYFVETLNSYPNRPISGFEASVQFEPMFTLVHDIPNRLRASFLHPLAFRKRGPLQVYRYDRVWERMLKRRIHPGGMKTYLGAFVDWDNSPRRGRLATMMRGATPGRFGKYLQRQLARSQRLGSEFLFINAWNEWAEGTYLEPDKRYGPGYLQAVRKAMYGG